MRTIYLYVEKHGITRKVGIDMAYLSEHKKIRLPKYYLEEGLYLLHRENKNYDSEVQKYYLSKDKIASEDEHFYYYDFPFNFKQVFDIAV